ncbi:MAG: efflux RND transporter permease subunit [Planctomycetota bacterium]|nr:efflux RND transporter permease subunit [Planctomycetota bacterium]
MNLPRFAVEHKTLINFVVFLLVVGGFASYFGLGRLEDPDFTIKVGVIITRYPGASPVEVELEVTDRVEQALQEMPELDNIYSFSRAGLSIVRVEMKEEFWADTLPQVWDQMRKKIRDVTPYFPPGVLKPEIIDDFSFVYGFVLAVTGDGYSYAELEEYVKELRKELGLVPGVSRAELWGVQPKVIFLDISQAQLAELGISSEDILATLAVQNMVVNAGAVEVPGRRLRIETTGEFKTPEDIGELIIRRSLMDMVATGASELAAFSRVLEESIPMGSASSGSSAHVRSGEVIRLKDVATIRQGYLEPPIAMMRFQGQPALAVQVANIAGGNIIETGKRVDRRLDELLDELPAGIEVEKFVWQSDLVRESIDGFVINLIEAVAIVLVVLTLAMGWRMGLIIGWALIVTILGTFIVMQLMDISLQRVSLGALVVALGMMVDNAIVVADGAVVRLGRGMKPADAAVESAAKPSLALLGATAVAVMAFYPVFAATTGTGEYARTLFIVVAISLALSWVLAMTMTPLNCISLLKPAKGDAGGADPYGGGFFLFYKRSLEGAIRWRALTIGGMAVLLVASAVGFTRVPQQFFPDSTRTQFMIDYWAPQGVPIQQVSADLTTIEDKLMADPRVKNVGAFIGMGGPRFYLPVDPEFPYASFAQLIVNTPTSGDVNSLVAELEPWLNENYSQAMTRVRKYTVGPGDTWPFEYRISGPADADLNILRNLADQGMAILKESGMAKQIRTDMRQPVQKVVVNYDQERARWGAVTRSNIAQATRIAYDGLPVGLYRDGDDMIPIIARHIEEDRRRTPGELDLVQVRPTLALKSIPLSQVADDVALEWEDPIITRFNRRRQIAVQAAPDGVTYPALRSSVVEQFEAIEMPPGYTAFWDGESDSTNRAQTSLIPGLIPAGVVMVLIIVGLFNALRPALIIALVIPFAIIGITAILLPTQTAFGFMALLGAMSLAGMMIKNSIVLLDEIKENLAAGKSPYESTVDAGVSRVRPVMLAAATTVLGVIPLLQDAFWVSMSMTIMAGLAFGTVLTMVLVPVFYATLYRIPSPTLSPSHSKSSE